MTFYIHFEVKQDLGTTRPSDFGAKLSVNGNDTHVPKYILSDSVANVPHYLLIYIVKVSPTPIASTNNGALIWQGFQVHGSGADDDGSGVYGNETSVSGDPGTDTGEDPTPPTPPADNHPDVPVVDNFARFITGPGGFIYDEFGHQVPIQNGWQELVSVGNELTEQRLQLDSYIDIDNPAKALDLLHGRTDYEKALMQQMKLLQGAATSAAAAQSTPHMQAAHAKAAAVVNVASVATAAQSLWNAQTALAKIVDAKTATTSDYAGHAYVRAAVHDASTAFGVGVFQQDGHMVAEFQNTTLYGGDAGKMFGGFGAKAIAIGSIGNDHLLLDMGGTAYLGPGADKVWANHSNFAFTIYLGAGDDAVYGSHKGDVLLGEAGNDTLFGDIGRDTMTGGAGKDHFLFTANGESGGGQKDRITDFQHGQDKLDFSQWNSATLNPDFFFGGTKFDHLAGEIIFSQTNKPGTANDVTTVNVDLDGDGRADQQILLTGLINLNGGDFVV